MKRTLLITLILGTILALAPAANAVAVLPDSGGSTGGAVFRTDVLGGDGYAASRVFVTDGWMSSVTSQAVTLRPDILGGHGGATAAPVANDSSFDWSTTLAVSLTGALLLALAGAAITRRRHRLSF